MRIKIDDFEALICPHCRCNNLHHDAVEVWSRDHEDGEANLFSIGGYEVKTNHGSAVVPVSMTFRKVDERTAPGRRDCLDIHFWCEQCDTKPTLRILQHKGSTIVAWLD